MVPETISEAHKISWGHIINEIRAYSLSSMTSITSKFSFCWRFDIGSKSFYLFFLDLVFQGQLVTPKNLLRTTSIRLKWLSLMITSLRIISSLRSRFINQKSSWLGSSFLSFFHSISISLIQEIPSPGLAR